MGEGKPLPLFYFLFLVSFLNSVEKSIDAVRASLFFLWLLKIRFHQLRIIITAGAGIHFPRKVPLEPPSPRNLLPQKKTYLRKIPQNTFYNI
jgi:hypothetical protein